jgi:hypothetical protein
MRLRDEEKCVLVDKVGQPAWTLGQISAKLQLSPGRIVFTCGQLTFDAEGHDAVFCFAFLSCLLRSASLLRKAPLRLQPYDRRGHARGRKRRGKRCHLVIWPAATIAAFRNKSGNAKFDSSARQMIENNYGLCRWVGARTSDEKEINCLIRGWSEGLVQGWVTAKLSN